MVNGVSVVICAHNSGSKISPTIAHLAAQVVPKNVRWEVLLIDNASTDDTIAIAQNEWNGVVPLRIIHESQLGISYARWRGISEATYEIVSFVDDDNWVDEDWVATVSDIMIRYPEVGACGGYNEGAFEKEPPVWFPQFCRAYAIHEADVSTGNAMLTQRGLFGAGFSVRRDALLSLRQQGFRSLLTDRQGTALSSGGDVELYLALLMAGWQLWLDSRLHLWHYMPAHRLQWDYLRRLVRASAASTVTTEAYRMALKKDPNPWRRKIEVTWQGQLAIHLKQLLWHPRRVASYFFTREEGNPDVIWMERQLGRLTAILQQRQALTNTFAQVLDMQWSK